MKVDHLVKCSRELLGLDLSPEAQRAFGLYADQLVAWNQDINLTAITEPREIVIKHFLDSLSAARSVPPAARVIDVGAGAGFPGLPIKIAQPDISLTLLEATRKKCEFLRAIIDELHLTNVLVVNARAEDAAHDPAHRESYDVAMARAVAELPTLIEYLLPFVRIGGVAVAQKAKEAVNDVQHAEFAMTTLGGRLADIISVRVPELNEARYLVVIEKTAATPGKYPRRAGMPAKRPL